MKGLFVGLLLTSAFSLIGCTENTRARVYGGTGKYDVPANEKVVNVTWKESDLWILTKPMKEKDTADVYYFREESTFGVWEGTYIIQEHKELPTPALADLPVVGDTPYR